MALDRIPNAVKYSNQVFWELAMGVKERRQREKTQVRERILDAALEFFAREGVEGVTMRALADAIEYSPPVIYAHFKDKDAIIRELCNRQIRSLAQAFSTFGRTSSRISPSIASARLSPLPSRRVQARRLGYGHRVTKSYRRRPSSTAPCVAGRPR